MDDDGTTRRGLLATGATALGALAGCAATDAAGRRLVVDPTDPTPLSSGLGYDGGVLGWSGTYGDETVDGLVEDAGVDLLSFPGTRAAPLYDPAGDRLLTDPLARDPSDVVDRAAFESTAAYDRAVERLGAFQARRREAVADAPDPYGFAGYRAVTDAAGAGRLLELNLVTAPDGASPVERATAWVERLARDGVAVDAVSVGVPPESPARHLAGPTTPEGALDAAADIAAAVRDDLPDAAVLAPAPEPGSRPAFAAALAERSFYDALAAPARVRLGFDDEGGARQTGSGALRAARTAGVAAAPAAVDGVTAFADRAGAPVRLRDAGVVVPPAYAGRVVQALVEARLLVAALDRGLDGVVRRRLFGSPAGTVVAAPDGPVRTALYGLYGALSAPVARATHRAPAAVEPPRPSVTETAASNPGTALAVAALLEESRRLHLPFVNPAGEPRRVQLEVAGGLAPTGRAARQYVAGSLGARNAADDRDAVPLVQDTVPGGGAVELPRLSAGVVTVGLTESTASPTG